MGHVETIKAGIASSIQVLRTICAHDKIREAFTRRAGSIRLEKKKKRVRHIVVHLVQAACYSNVLLYLHYRCEKGQAAHHVPVWLRPAFGPADYVWKNAYETRGESRGTARADLEPPKG